MTSRILIPGPPERLQNYADALALAGAKPVFGLAAGPPCDGLLLPGGGDLDPGIYGQENTASPDADCARDAAELAAAAAYFAAGKPVLGICRGAQVLAVALGGTLRQQVDGHSALPDGTDRLHPTEAIGLMAAFCGAEPLVNSAHHQAVGKLPPGCRVLQTAPDGVVEAFSHDRLAILAVQWHPERLCGRFRRPGAADGMPVFRWFLTRCRERGGRDG